MSSRFLIALLLLGCRDKSDALIDTVPVDQDGSSAMDADGDG